MNIGATDLTQPATIGGSGGIEILDPSDAGLTVRTTAAAQRFANIGADFLTFALVAGDNSNGQAGFRFAGVADSASFQPIVGFDYDTSVFAGGGAIKWGNAAGTHLGALYVGSGVPNNAGGVNGDFALRSDSPGVVNTRLYVKSAGAWVGIL